MSLFTHISAFVVISSRRMVAVARWSYPFIRDVFILSLVFLFCICVLFFYFSDLKRESRANSTWMIIFHINHQLLTAKEVHFEYSIYLSLKRFYLIFDDLCRINLNFLFMDVLLKPTHIVVAIVNKRSPSIC